MNVRHRTQLLRSLTTSSQIDSSPLYNSLSGTCCTFLICCQRLASSSGRLLCVFCLLSRVLFHTTLLRLFSESYKYIYCNYCFPLSHCSAWLSLFFLLKGSTRGFIHTVLHSIVEGMPKLSYRIIPNLRFSVPMSQFIHVVNSSYVIQNKVI